MKEDRQVQDSTGNVFEDMGMRDAEERLAKAELARLIRTEIRDRGLSQNEAAALLGVKQPDVSDLVRGRLSRFSMARLERFLNALDLEIRIQVGPRPEGKVRAGITVESVKSF
jgi:predicted XRE-type DNA-binding protein